MLSASVPLAAAAAAPPADRWCHSRLLEAWRPPQWPLLQPKDPSPAPPRARPWANIEAQPAEEDVQSDLDLSATALEGRLEAPPVPAAASVAMTLAVVAALPCRAKRMAACPAPLDPSWNGSGIAPSASPFRTHHALLPQVRGEAASPVALTTSQRRPPSALGSRPAFVASAPRCHCCRLPAEMGGRSGPSFGSGRANPCSSSP